MALYMSKTVPGASILGLLLLMPLMALAQPEASPTFEVASVKPSNPKGGAIGLFTYPGGRITASQCTLELLILQAFDIEPFQISGGPTWVREDRYDIEAKPPASSKSSKSNPPYPKAPPNEEQRKMLQTLLADRFKLRVHHETREGPVYLLVKGNKPLKLQEPQNKDAYPWAGSNTGGATNGDGLAGINISMPQLARRLSRELGRSVLDQTGLNGSFDFKFEYGSDDSASDVIPSIFTSLQGIGLKLESGKGRVQTIVIEHVERPSEN